MLGDGDGARMEEDAPPGMLSEAAGAPCAAQGVLHPSPSPGFVLEGSLDKAGHHQPGHSQGCLRDQVEMAQEKFWEALPCKASGFQESLGWVLIPPCR